MNPNKIKVFALPDCTECDRVEDTLKAKGISYTLVYDKRVEYRANQLGKCSSPQTPCDFISDQRKIALQKSGVNSDMKYPFVFHNDQYILRTDLETHDFSNSSATSVIKPAILIYSGDASCYYCHLAKTLLREKNIKFIVKDQKEDPFPDICGQELRSSYPKIYIDDECIGGFNELKRRNQTGKLDRYITPASSTSSDTSKSKSTAIQTPIQNKPFTQVISPSPINNGIVITENSLQILLSFLKPLPVQNETQKKILEANQYEQFIIWIKMQGQPLKTMHSWKMPDGHSFLQKLTTQTCSQLIWETVIREASLENIHTIKNYLDSDCSANKEIKMLLDYYSSKQDVYCHYSPLNEGIDQEDYCEEKIPASHLGASWEKILVVQSGLGILQGFMSALLSLLTPILEKSHFVKKLPQLRGTSLLSFILPAFVQACSTLVLYPFLTPTVWRNLEELESLSVQIETLTTYFISSFANSFAVQLGLHELQQWIEKDSSFSDTLKPYLKSIIPYLDSLDSLFPRLLSYSTYTHAKVEATGFACNQISRWIARGLSLFAITSLKKCSPKKNVAESEEVEMQEIAFQDINVTEDKLHQKKSSPSNQPHYNYSHTQPLLPALPTSYPTTNRNLSQLSSRSTELKQNTIHTQKSSKRIPLILSNEQPTEQNLTVKDRIKMFQR